MDSDPTVYHTMNGPSEFHTIGSLLDWNITDRLPGIDVPTLLISGEFDEATPHIVEQIHTRIPGARWELVAGTSHLRTSRSRRSGSPSSAPSSTRWMRASRRLG